MLSLRIVILTGIFAAKAGAYTSTVSLLSTAPTPRAHVTCFQTSSPEADLVDVADAPPVSNRARFRTATMSRPTATKSVPDGVGKVVAWRTVPPGVTYPSSGTVEVPAAPARGTSSSARPTRAEPEDGRFCANIKVVGVGGGGGNTVSRIPEELHRTGTSVDLVLLNTDSQALEAATATGGPLASYDLQTTAIQLDPSALRGLGAGGDPSRGRLGAEGSAYEISDSLHGADLVFITAGMGGGTGSGAAPKVAQLAKAAGALTVAVVSRPFHFEGAARMRVADAAISDLAAEVRPATRAAHARRPRTPPTHAAHARRRRARHEHSC